MVRFSLNKARKILTVSTLLIVVACSSELTDVEYVQRARDSLDKKDYASAVVDFKSALAQNVSNAEARWELGKLYLEIGSLLSAEKELVHAQKLGVGDEYTAPLLARIYLSMGKYEEIHALSIKPTYKSETKAELSASKALAFLGQGQTDGAKSLAGTAKEIIPTSPYVQYAEAAILFADGQVDAARETLEVLLKTDDDYASAWSLLGDLERRTNNLEAAESAYGRAINNRLNNANDLLSRAMVRVYQNKLDLAQQDVDVLKQRAEGNYQLHYTQGLILYLQKKYAEAQVSFDSVVNVDRGNHAAIFYLGSIHFHLGNTQQAQSYLSTVVGKAPGFLPARKLLATQNLALEEFENVEGLLRPVVSTTTEDEALINLYADALFGLGKKEEALKWLRLAEELAPDSADAKARLGQALLASDDENGAIEALNAAIQLDPKSQQADVLLVQSYLKTKNYKAALLTAEEFLERQPENPAAHNLHGLVLLTQRQLENAKKAFERALHLSPGHIYAGKNLAQLAFSESDFEKARTLYEEVLKYNPNDLETLIRLAGLEAKVGNNEQMRDVLQQAISAHPDAVKPKVILAKSYLVEGKPNQAMDVVRDVVSGVNDAPELIGILGQAQMQNQVYREASHTFLRLIELEPEAVQAHFLLGVCYARLNEGQKMERAFVRTLELDDRHVLARIALTRTQVLHKEFGKARDNLRKLKDLAPNAPDVLAIEETLKAEQ